MRMTSKLSLSSLSPPSLSVSARLLSASVLSASVLLVQMLGVPDAGAQDRSGESAADVEADFDDAFADFDDFDSGFDEERSTLVFSGFVEGAYGRKLDADPLFTTRQSLGDLRGRLETEWANEQWRVTFKGDALYDDYESDFDIDARELSFQVAPGDSVDLKVGRQVLTWGTGDLLFLNDLFPKSWVSFFSGRDDEYLKAPSNAVRTTWYNPRVNLDIVWSPRFEADDYLTGERFSFFSPLAGAIVAPKPPLAGTEPPGFFENGELALRLFRTVGSVEYAAYGYRGFFKRPLGVTASFVPFFPRLDVVGASLRRPFGDGLFNAEFAYHDSRDDAGGTNPLIPNDQLRLLVGYEFEARPRFTVGLQYYLERTLDHGELIASSPWPAFEPDVSRHLLTNRLTYRNARDKLTLSLFTFYSPSDRDYYLRPSVAYRRSDEWTISAGANLFAGDRLYTFFGQLEDNSNLYMRVRFNY